MTNKLFCNRRTQLRSSKFVAATLVGAFCLLAAVPPCRAGDAPQWMHALVNAPLPAHDEKTNAVLLYSETNVNVISADKIQTTVREAYKILRPDGRGHGIARVYYRSPGEKVTSLHGWCIPAQGKDYEVKDKEAVDRALEIDGGDLVDDAREKILRIPAPDPGNIVGYEYEIEEQPLFLQELWGFQEVSPVRESHYSLQLPAGWEFKASFLNYPEVRPTSSGNNLWQWTVTDVKGIRPEDDMPPFAGVAGAMIVSFITQGDKEKQFSNWREMGNWYRNLASGRRDASPQIKQEVAQLTTSSPTTLDKMKVLGNFVQHDIRYVSIQLGIGGVQPHPAADIFTHHYGDCKDKATLMGSMLHEIGVDSYYVVINDERGAVGTETPATVEVFNHVIVAIKLGDEVRDPSLVATMQHPKLGRLLFFDPTNDLVPLGQIPEYEQASYALLVTPEGGDLVQVPKQPAAMNSIVRTAKLTLDPSGKLQGEVKEVRLGERAWQERETLLTATRDADRVKPIEELLGSSLSNFQITNAKVINLKQTSLPFGFEYSFEAANYAKSAGGLLLLRPRVIGSKSSPILETKEPRQFAIEFEGPVKDTDSFEITLPPGYEVDDLPPPVDADYEFASYHSKTEVKGDVIGYTRTFEVKELSVPASQSEELRKFYRIIAGDERNTAVLKPK